MENLKRVWKSVLDEIEVVVTKPTFVAFFAPTTLVSVEDAVATIGCNTSVSVSMIETRYYALIKKLIDKHTGQNVSLLFKVSPQKISKPKNAGPLFSPISPATPTTSSTTTQNIQLRPDFNFETFAVSSSNHMAYAAATAVSQSVGVTYNPLFLYGGVGVGKTHLMQAVGNEVLTKQVSTKVIYCMGEEFTNEIIEAIQTKTTRRFKNKYRSAKLLLIDDVQFLEGKLKVQEEFFHTFNAVVRAGGQVVLTSDRPPAEIDRLEERLQSRFEGGLLVDVQKPDFELRCAIIRIKAQQQGIDLPVSIAQVLAANTESVRKLEGLLARLLTESRVNKHPLTEELAHSIVGRPEQESTSNNIKKHLTPKTITEKVMHRFGVTLGQLRSNRRSRPVARPRQVLMYLLRTELELPLEEVGALVGGRDHTTVMHAVDKISSLLSTNSKMREDMSWIKGQLRG